MKTIQDKVRALLALADPKNGASENEMEQAMAAAQRLMLEHNIEHLNDANPKMVEGFRPLDVYKWQTWIFATAATMCGCMALNYPNGVGFNGRVENVENAWAMYDFIRAQIESLYKLNLTRGLSVKDRAEYRRTFKQTCSLHIYIRAQKIIDAMKGSGTDNALMIVPAVEKLQAEARASIEQRGIALKDQHRKHRFKFGSGTVDGFIAGESVDIQSKVGT